MPLLRILVVTGPPPPKDRLHMCVGGENVCVVRKDRGARRGHWRVTMCQARNVPALLRVGGGRSGGRGTGEDD